MRGPRRRPPPRTAGRPPGRDYSSTIGARLAVDDSPLATTEQGRTYAFDAGARLAVDAKGSKTAVTAPGSNGWAPPGADRRSRHDARVHAPPGRHLPEHGRVLRSACRPGLDPCPAPGRFSKDDFAVDLGARTVTCPAGRVALPGDGGLERTARFGRACAVCPPASRCTASSRGRTIAVGADDACAGADLRRRPEPAHPQS